MRFIIQNDSVLQEEANTLKKILEQKENTWFHTYKEISLSELDDFSLDPKDDIPVGTIEFVRSSLIKMGLKETDIMRPIEVPECLRKEKYLHREYHIVSYQELVHNKNQLSHHKHWYIKDASKLKNWNNQKTTIKKFLEDVKVNENYNKHNYVLSAPINIIGEYRVLVVDNTAVAVQSYNTSDALLFPNGATIRQMICDIQLVRDFRHEELPTAYTLDIAVHLDADSDGNMQQYTSIIEMHNFIACGTYGFSGNDLVRMYKEGILFERAKFLQGKIQLNNFIL